MKTIDGLAKWMEANRNKVMVLDDTSTDLVLKALTEYKQYKEIGTVEEIKEILQIVSEGQEDVDESGISTGLLHTLLEYARYKRIGTLEECREAMEKQKPKKVSAWGDGVADDGKILYDMYTCPGCGKNYESDYDDFKHCPACGQRMDRSEP